MSTAPESLQSAFERAFAALSQVRAAFTPELAPREVGTITSVATGIAKVSGLPGVGFEEWSSFPAACSASHSTSTRTKSASCCSATTRICTLATKSSARAESWTWPWATAWWDASSTRSAGRSMARAPVVSSGRLPIERPAAAIMDRAPVTVPLQTGLKVIDALIPIGRGQRELILGDRQTGKTAIAMDTI